MEYNNPSEIVKTLTFGKEANDQIIAGVEKLANAVKSTLGASGKCVIYEDALGRPVITKDGVTVAESVVLLHPVENIGATLIKQAARNTVREAGDGTTTSTVLANSLLKITNKHLDEEKVRELKAGIISGANKVKVYLDKTSIPVKGQMLQNVAIISCNNDKELGTKIGEAYEQVGKNGIVLMEESDTNETYVDFVEGVQFDSGLKSPHLITDKDKGTAVLDDPYVLIVSSPIPNIRKIQSVLEYVIKNSKSLLVIGDLSPEVLSALAMNKTKGNIKVNVIEAPTLGVNRKQMFDDLALLTGSTLINEDLGDDMDLIEIDHLGSCLKSITDQTETIIQLQEINEDCLTIIKDIKDKLLICKIPDEIIRLEKRLAMLAAKIAVVKVGANSDIELKEKMDRVEDAVCATKAAIKEGIVPGGGIALLNASNSIKSKSKGESILLEAISAPFKTILENAGIIDVELPKIKGRGLNVLTGKTVDMIKSGIIDPLLVTKSALKNAASVATTILSTDCVINNIRIDESNR